MTIFANDGVLLQALQAVSSRLRGFGGSSDAGTSFSVNELAPLSDGVLSQLYRGNTFIQKVVGLLPEDSAILNPIVVMDSSVSDRDGSDVIQYINTLDAIALFSEAGRDARLYGDSYLVLGIDDGLDPSEPVATDKIKGISFIKLRDADELYKARFNDDFYTIAGYDDPDIPILGTIHESRVLHFCGTKLPKQIAKDRPSRPNDSVIQRMFNDFVDFTMGRSASSTMLQTSSIFTYKLKGLRQLIIEGKQDALESRFAGIMQGLSTMRGLFVDAEAEDASYINRSFGGVDAVLSQLVDIFVGAADLPKSKLFNCSGSSAFSEGGQSDRYEWASAVNRYQNLHWESQLRKLVRYVFLAKDSAFRGVEPDSWSIEFPSILQLTPKEEAELRKLHAEADNIAIANKTLGVQEVRQSRYGGSNYGYEITLDQASYDAEIAESRELLRMANTVQQEDPGDSPEDDS